jgi:ketosteroid isomerase-like protein
MDTNAATIETFYRAFQDKDYTAMTACYHPDIHFSDPVFTDLCGDEARAMWHMLCEQGTDLVVTYSGVKASGDRGAAHWEARYTFTPTGRPVHNKIDAAFVFDEGLIIRHIDTFGLWKWTRMALGATGTFIGWTGMAKAKVQKAADLSLRRFLDEHPEYASPDRG